MALIAALTLILAVGIGLTMAWLMDKPATLTNKFTKGDVDIELTETTGTDYMMVPGLDIEKDPLVTVVANSEKAYVFIKLEGENDFDTFVDYTVATGWTQLQDDTSADVKGVFYRVVDKTNANQEFPVLTDNKVTVKETVTKEDLANIDANNPAKLNVTAYAIQFAKNSTTDFTPYQAWKEVTTP